MTRRLLALALVSAMGLSLSAANADHTPNPQGCPIHITDTSAEDPNVVDFANDWDGVVFGNETATVPAGDVYREGTDLLATWLHRDEAGAITAHVRVANLSTLQPNAIFYVLWSYEGTNVLKSRRWVSARLKGYGTAFTYGYQAVNPVTGNNSFVTEGDTSGSFVEGANGEVIVNVPKGGTTITNESNDDWGAPATGSTLGDVQGESRLLLGSPEPVPPNPSGFRHGFVYQADLTTDGSFFCDAYVNA